LLAKREGSQTKLALRPGVGNWVGRAPWKIEWGGGASVENPHYQRVHYCELLVRDFLMRCKSQRFPSIQKDINMVLAHCGSLFLDPVSLEQAGHELVVLEKLHTHPEFSPGASLEAMTRPPLSRC
jgi:protein arginine N-methyltransferase 7